jgi:chromatin remodeling complex protein RSC6
MTTANVTATNVKTKRTKRAPAKNLENETLERETLERETLERETRERESRESVRERELESKKEEKHESETLEAEVEVEVKETMKEKFEKLISSHQENIKRSKESIVLLKESYKQYTYELKHSRRRKRVEGPQKMNGFSKPTELREELYDFLSVCGVSKGELVPRTRVTSLVHNYIKEKELGNKEKKIEFFPDKRLAKLLGPARDFVDKSDESLGKFYNKMRLQQYLSQYYPKKEEK